MPCLFEMQRGILGKAHDFISEYRSSCFIASGFRIWVGRAGFRVPGERRFAHLLHPPSRCQRCAGISAAAAVSAEGEDWGPSSRSSPVGGFTCFPYLLYFAFGADYRIVYVVALLSLMYTVLFDIVCIYLCYGYPLFSGLLWIKRFWVMWFGFPYFDAVFVFASAYFMIFRFCLFI